MLVNICCSESSGSTFFSYILDRHPEIACGNELKFLAMPIFYFDYKKAVEGSSIIRDYGISGNPYFAKVLTIKNLSSYNLHEKEVWKWVEDSENINQLAKKFKNYILDVTGKSIWAEKTPSNIRIIEKFIKSFPDARIIHIVRDPRDVILSLMNRGFGLLEAADHWLASVAAIQNFKDNKNIFEVRYEDLITDSKKWLRKICTFLGVEFKKEYFFEDRFKSKVLSQFRGFDSWNLKPDQGFSSKSIGKYKNTKQDFTSLYSLRLTEEYANLIGTKRYSLIKLANEYNYNIPEKKETVFKDKPVYNRYYWDRQRKEEQRKYIGNQLENVSLSKKIAIYGAGEHTEYLLQYFNLEEINIKFIVDQNKNLWKNKLKGYNILSPEALIKQDIDSVIISSLTYQTEIKNYLQEELNFKGEIIILYKDQDFLPFYINKAHKYEKSNFIIKTKF